MSLFHVFLNSKSPRAKENNLTYKTLIKSRDSKQNLYLEQLNEGVLSSKEYYGVVKKLINESNKEKKRLNKEKRQINRDFSFRGRSSFHFWVFVFGLVTALFYFACKSLFDELSKGSTFKHQLVSLSGVIVACFWIIHLLFFTQSDFNKNTYFLTILGIAVLFSIFTYFLVKYYTYKDQIIYNLLSLVGRIKNKHYQRIATKAMYSEKNERSVISLDTTKENIKDFDKDIAETLKKM